MKEKKYVLLKDIVIPKGTVLHCEDGRTSKYVSGNYGTTIGLTKDSCGEFIYGIDEKDKELPEWLVEVKE